MKAPISSLALSPPAGVLLGFSLLGGCGSGHLAMNALQPPGTTSPSAARIMPSGEELAPARVALRSSGLGRSVRHLFLSDAALNVVTIFGKGDKTRTLTGFDEPQGLTTDSLRNLYVANTIAENIPIFAPPYRGKPASTLEVPGQWPVDIAVAPDGTVAAVNICQASGSRCGGPGSVYFYANNQAASPCAIISGGSKISRLLWGGFDAAGTLYVAGVNDYTTTEIGSVASECAASTLRSLRPNVTIAFPAGIQVDPTGRIAVVESNGFSGAARIDIFAPPKRASRQLLLLEQGMLAETGVVVSFALNKDGTELYTAEPHYSLEYPYPKAGNEIREFFPPPSGGDLIEGVAVTPAAVP